MLTPYRTVVIDLHNMTVTQAKSTLRLRLDSMPGDVAEVEVLHGFHGGTALKNMVMNFTHPKIERKMLTLNQGSTMFVLKKANK